MTKMANAAGIPIVYVNRMPADSASLGGTSTFVGSNETWSGTLAAFELCNLAGGAGNAVMLQGILSNEAAITRSKDFEEVLALSMCNGITLEAVEVGSWQRSKGNDIVSNWLSSGMEIDIVFANNDEMGLGAVQAFKNAGISMDDVLIGSVDATADALASMAAGELDVTVFQNAAGQATGGIDAAIAAINGESLPNSITIPFELVTPDNMADYMGAN
jgi:ABC-type sugar transport system substrate-binding protein